MKSDIVLWMLGINVFLAGCSFSHDQTSMQTQQVIKDLPEVKILEQFVVGKPAPSFSSQTMQGDPFDVSEYYGRKAIILNFWASWCPDCLIELPELQNMYQLNTDQLMVIGIHRTETETIASGLDFIRDIDITFPLVQDNGNIYTATGGIGMPVAVFINQEGVVNRIKIGPKNPSQLTEEMKQLVE